jgi:threonylcarbamoyladenosine tRNA methylthiotransferase MtaB
VSEVRRPRVSLYALGCRVNQYEMRHAAEELLQRGCHIVPFGQPADVCIVNTCSVTDQADAKSRAVLRRAGRIGDDPIVVATGCYADVAPEAVGALPGVAHVVRNAEKPRLPEIVEDLLRQSGRLLFDLDTADDAAESAQGLVSLVPDEAIGRTRAVIKIQDGCNHFCSFCIIPFARGRLRSRPPADVLAEARRLACEGYREIVLAGICLGDYGDERALARAERDPLALLLEALSAIDGIARIRLSSIDPCDVSPDLIDAMAALPRVCRHLHLSLQSGDEEVLRRMRRRYTADRFRELCQTLHARMPGIGLTSDMIVGFPGETDEQFLNSCRMAEEVGFSRIHVFKYSPRTGTLAARWRDDVPPGEKERRSRWLMEVSDRLALQAASAAVGSTVQVLVENRDRHTGMMTGLTDNYLRVHFDGDDDLRGQLVHVQIQSAGVEGVYGRGDDDVLHLLPDRGWGDPREVGLSG